MVSHHFVYQLVLFALIWLFIIVHLNRPKCPVLAPATPTAEPEPLKPPTPPLQRASTLRGADAQASLRLM